MHSYNQKVSPYYYLFNRLHSLPLQERNFKIEQNHIYDVALEHGFNRREITRIEQKVITRLKRKDNFCTTLRPNTPKDEKNKTIVFTFNNCITKSWENSFKSMNFKIAYKPGTQIYKAIRNNKDIIDNNKKYGVYAVNCLCSSTYVGQTRRNLGTRLKEHREAINRGDLDYSGVSKHMLENATGVCGLQNANLLHSGIKYNQLDFLESLEIRKHNNNMNLNSGFYTTCESFKYLL